MNADGNKYEVKNVGSDSWRPATESEIAQAMRTTSRYYEWKGHRMTDTWTCIMGLASSLREFRCTAA